MVSKGAAVAAVLMLALGGAGVAYALSRKGAPSVASLVLMVTPTSGTQFFTTFTVAVHAYDANGKPVPGVKVGVVGPWAAVAGTTDASGFWSGTTPPALEAGTTSAIATGGGATSNSVPITIAPFWGVARAG